MISRPTGARSGWCSSTAGRAEQLRELRQLETTALVTHSSLSQEQRRQAEEAFASRENCVIVATSRWNWAR